MSQYNSLKATIDANVKQNGVQAITGQILNSVLNAMVNTLGAGYQFAGVATTATNPGSPDAKVFYIANGKGTYTNFGGLQVTEDDVVVLYWDSSWHKVSTGIASQVKLSELGNSFYKLLWEDSAINTQTGADIIGNESTHRRLRGFVSKSLYQIVESANLFLVFEYDSSYNYLRWIGDIRSYDVRSRSDVSYFRIVYRKAQNTDIGITIRTAAKEEAIAVINNQYGRTIQSLQEDSQSIKEVLSECLPSHSSGYYAFDTDGMVEQGGVMSDGSFQGNASNRLRIKELISTNGYPIRLSIQSGYANLNWFDENRNFIAGSNSGWINPSSEQEYSRSGAKYCSIHFKNNAGTDITPSAFNSLGFSLKTYVKFEGKKAAPIDYVDEKFLSIVNKSLNPCEVSDGFKMTAASAAHIQHLDKPSNCFVTYLGSRTGTSESSGLIMLSMFPLEQPERAKHFVVAERAGVLESNCLLVDNNTLRVFYFDNGYNTDASIPKTNYYKDFNISTETFGEEVTMQIKVGSTYTNLTNIVAKSYLNSVGVNCSYIWGCITTCRPVYKDGYWYWAITSNGSNDGTSLFGGQPILFVKSADGFAKSEIVGYWNIANEYECQIEWDSANNVWHVLTRAGKIYHSTTTDFHTFSNRTEIQGSIASRPQIFKYKNGVLIVTNKTNNMTGLIGGESSIPPRSRIVGQIVNASNINNSQVVLDISSRYGLVYPSFVNNHGELYMVFSNGEKMETINNDGKQAIQYVKIGEVQSNVTGETYIVVA